MGADFIGSFVPVSRSLPQALEALHALSDAQIKSALHNTNLDSEWDDGETFWVFADDGDPQINREALMPELEKYVRIVYDVVDDNYRVASWFRHDDVLFACTGGLSWGDTPDLVDEMGIVYFLGVTYDPTKKLAWVDA